MNLKINKKGVFYSLSVIIVIIMLLLIFNNRLQMLNNDAEFNLERVKMIVMNRFVSDFDNYYAKNIIETATKPALIAITQDGPLPFTNANLIDLMSAGDNGIIIMNKLYSTNNNFNQSLRTLTFQLDKAVFTYDIEDIKQINYTTIMISFNAEYHFSSFNTTWEKTGKIINITVPVYGLMHPDYSNSIDTDWVENLTASDCYINQIFAPPPGCTSNLNIMPPLP